MKRATNTLFVVLMVFLTLVFSACSHEDPLLEDASGHAFYNYFDSYENLLKDPCSLSLCGGGGSGGGGVSSGVLIPVARCSLFFLVLRLTGCSY